MFTKIVVLLIFAAIVASLGSGAFYLVRDRGHTDRMVKALTLRIGLSVLLFVLLLVLYALGFIQPHGLLPPSPG